MPQTIKIFLASSAELKDEREKFEQFIGRKNKILHKRNIFIDLEIWEDFIDAISKTRSQDEYNKAVRGSDIFVMLFATKVGRYTREEFEAAFGQFQESGKPWIYTYFRTESVALGSILREDIKSLWDFQDRLKELGHYQTQYDNSADLINKFSGQLEKRNLFHEAEQLQPEDVPQLDGDPVRLYLDAIAEKYAILPMLGFKRSFDMDSIYIPLTVHDDPESRFGRFQDKAGGETLATTLKAEDLVGLSDRVTVVLGAPGMGKTTMQRYLSLRESKKSNGLFPIFVKLADFSKTGVPLEAFLLAAVDITSSAMQAAARNAIQGQRALILLDGLDEVARGEYTGVTDRIRTFIASHKNCRIIITSRNAGFKSHELPYRIFEIDRLPLVEIEAFVNKWFEKETDLAKRIKANPRIRELAQNPFLLSIICAIFERDQNLPQRRLDLYRKSAVTLLTLYDEKQVPKVNGFTQFLKERVLEDLAYHFFCKGVDEFPYQLIIGQVGETLKGMGKNCNEDDVLREICENSGLLQKSDGNYLFVHRTFYEYYVACKMRGDLPETVLNRTFEVRWEEPTRLYAAQIEKIAEGTQFITELWKKDRALALRCYPDMDKVVEADLIKKLLNEANVRERVELVKGLPGKIAVPDKLVETLCELFRWETNGEVIYWGVQILEERREIPGALEIVHQKLDKDAAQRYRKYIETDMVHLPGGNFKMGGKEEEDEKPMHKVKLDGFSISRYQVTNRLYEEFDSDHKKRRDKYSNKDEQPVVNVNWYEAVIFCRWLGCRLPTEAEWEYACYASTTTPFNTGGNLTNDQANYNGNYPYKDNPKGKFSGKTTPVGSYPPNAWGLYNMHGNVLEWCLDWYGEKYYNECKQQGITDNPKGPETGSYRVLRVGIWGGRCGRRYSRSPVDRNTRVGFRLVFVP